MRTSISSEAKPYGLSYGQSDMFSDHKKDKEHKLKREKDKNI